MPYIDPIESSPDHYTVLLENEHVRMLEMIVPPGAGVVRHSLPEKTVYFITGGKTKVTTEDGSVAEMELPDGATMWHEAWTH